MPREALPLFRTLERKEAYVLGVDDATFVAEVRGFLRWALADLTVRPHLLGLLNPPEEVARFIEAAPLLIADAGDVVHWLRGKDPEACAKVATAESWAEFDRIVASAREQPSPEHAEVAASVFAMMRAARESVGRSFRDRTDDESVAAWRAAVDLGNSFEHRVKERDLAVRISPGHALVQLITLARGHDVLPTGTPHWSDFARDAVAFGGAKLEDMSSTRSAFRRLVEGLLTSIEGSSSSRGALLRFKERTVWFDRERLRELAQKKGESALTLELGRYLHDAGLPVLVRLHGRAVAHVRVPGVAARAVLPVGSDRADVLRGLRELHAQLVAFDAASVDVEEGLLAVFCVDGPLFELPPSVRTERFTIHVETIDLGAADVAQRKTIRVAPEEAAAAMKTE